MIGSFISNTKISGVAMTSRIINDDVIKMDNFPVNQVSNCTRHCGVSTYLLLTFFHFTCYLESCKHNSTDFLYISHKIIQFLDLDLTGAMTKNRQNI